MSKDIRKFDKNNNLIHWKNSTGYEFWQEFDKKNNLIHYKDSNNLEYWYKYDENNEQIEITKQGFEDHNKIEEIVIIMEGGLIQEIKTPNNFNMTIKIRDYDVEGLEAEKIVLDKTGKECYEYYEI